MCGFVAMAGSRSTRESVVESGLQMLLHRGPDGTGVWRAPDGNAALGHARLAIIDLSSAGAQPMVLRTGEACWSPMERFTIIVSSAVSSMSPFDSSCDTEVLLELLRARGGDALAHLRGMFAFAYWDGDELLLGRDRLGIKPLYYAECRGETRGLRESPPSSRCGPSLRAWTVAPSTTTSRTLYVPPPRTGIAGVRELPPGHTLRWSARRGGALERYWQVPSRRRGQAPTGQRVRALLDDAVAAHLESDVPVGVFLSGGLDSSSLVALAAPHTSGALKTFSVTFGDEGRHLDERRFAREVASRFSTDHREIRVEADVAAILPELVQRFGQPFGNPTAVLTYALSRAARAYVKVALAGDGGDELLGGYPRYRGSGSRSSSVACQGRRWRGLGGPSGAWAHRAQRGGASPVAWSASWRIPTNPIDTMYFRAG